MVDLWVGYLLPQKKITKSSFYLTEFKLVLPYSFSKKARMVLIPQKYQDWFICSKRCMCKPQVLINDLQKSAGKLKSDYISCSAALILSSPVLQVYFVWTKSLGEFPICLCVRVICGRHYLVSSSRTGGPRHYMLGFSGKRDLLNFVPGEGVQRFLAWTTGRFPHPLCHISWDDLQ